MASEHISAPGHGSLLCYRSITASLKPGRRIGLRRMHGIGLRIGGDGCASRMSQRSELTSPSLTSNPAPAPGSATGPVSGSAAGPTPEPRPASQQAAGQAPQRIPRWLERSELFLRVLLRMYIGLALVYAPWSAQVWTFLPWSRDLWEQNPLFVQFPTLGIYAANGAVRGIISGLGLLHLWSAFQDALRHWDG